MTGDLRAAVAWTGDAVEIIDQTRLPAEELVLRLTTPEEVVEAIARLAVRGAPAIGICGAFGVVLAADQLGPEATAERMTETAAAVRAARPTAVNLAWALREVQAADDPAERAREIHREEVERCRRMAEHAVSLFTPHTRALTHCNTGALATGGYGTALGALRRAWEDGLLRHVLVDETRPLLQGSRLTAWELEALGVSHAVIADAAAASLMAAGEVDCVVTGADRIAANGDTANKIGTYGLAVLARHHAIPFYVVAPSSTIDLETPSGDEIPIEERDGAELTPRFRARNPAFDVTPAGFVSAIVTEHGVHRAPYADSLAAALATA